MQVSATTWSMLSKLLDEALDLDAAARDTWLERLSATQPALAPSVRKLLEAHASSETADVMARLPTLNGAASAVRVSALQAGDRIGPYRLKREIGTGGMADVWLAERADGAFTREVALKLPLINRLRRDLAQRFARERDILARLEHPHIARLYDAGVTDDGLPYLAMEYVDGQPIIEYCDAHKLTIEARLGLFGQVLDAVQFAHASLIIHRDLKPSNILVTAEGQVRLLDFGIAKLLADDDTARETQLTQLSGRAFTPDYASPEQIKGEPLTIATDIYSLGVVLYELLAGSRPYRLKVNSAAQLEQAILEAQPVRPSSTITASHAEARATSKSRLAHMLAGDLDTIVLKALSKSPASRYATIASFADDLIRQQAGRPIRARPASLSYRFQKFVFRNKLAVAAVTATTVTLVAATGISIWQARVASKQTIAAQREAKRAEAVQSFLLNLFQASGSQQRSAQERRQMTAVQLLESGVNDVDKLQESAPDAHAYLLRTFGTIHEELELHDRSLQLHQRSVVSARKLYGSESRETARAELELAWILRSLQRTDEAQPLIAHASNVLRTTAPHSADYAQALYTESALIALKNPPQAVKLAAAAVQLLQTLKGDDYRAATSLYVYADALTASGDCTQAAENLRKAADAFERLYGADHIELGWMNTKLAECLRVLGQFESAQAALQRAIAVFEAHPEKRATGVAQARASLSRIKQALGDWQGARSQIDQAIASRRGSTERVMPTIDQLERLQAILLIEQGSMREGIAELSKLQRSIPVMSPIAGLVFADAFARAYLAIGELETAQQHVRQAQQIISEHGAPQSRVLSASIVAADVEAANGHTEKALAAIEAARNALKSANNDSLSHLQVTVAEARVNDRLGKLSQSRDVSEPWVKELLSGTGQMALVTRGEFALLAARARIETEPAVARQLSRVAVDALRKTQDPKSPLLRRAEDTDALLTR